MDEGRGRWLPHLGTKLVTGEGNNLKAIGVVLLIHLLQALVVDAGEAALHRRMDGKMDRHIGWKTNRRMGGKMDKHMGWKTNRRMGGKMDRHMGGGVQLT